MLRNLLCLSLLYVGLAAPLARADEPPDPPKIRKPPPPPPPEPAKVEAPAKVETPTPVETPTKVEAPAEIEAPTKVDAPAGDVKTAAPATETKKTEAGGMCRVDATAGAWPLLALVGLGVRRRRR